MTREERRIKNKLMMERRSVKDQGMKVKMAGNDTLMINEVPQKVFGDQVKEISEKYKCKHCQDKSNEQEVEVPSPEDLREKTERRKLYEHITNTINNLRNEISPMKNNLPPPTK